jgi:hypothetical protein
LVFGSAIHKAIETFDGDIDKAKLVYHLEFDKKKLEPKEYLKYDELLPIGEKILDVYFEKKDFLHKLHDIAEADQKEMFVEGVLENPLTGEKLPIPMKGRIDELTKNSKIKDYKTSGKFYDINDEGFKFQTKLYSLWYWSAKKKLAGGVVYFVLPKSMKLLESGTPIQVINLQFSLEELAETFEKTKNLLSQIEQGEFKPGRCLAYCDHRKLDGLLLPSVT